MQFDFFDKKVREAADRHHPSYDEQAWKRMQKLLDRHLPVEEERRRRFLFLIPLFLLLGAGTWYFTQDRREVKNNVDASQELSQQDKDNGTAPRREPGGLGMETPAGSPTGSAHSQADGNLVADLDPTSRDRATGVVHQPRVLTGSDRSAFAPQAPGSNKNLVKPEESATPEPTSREQQQSKPVTAVAAHLAGSVPAPDLEEKDSTGLLVEKSIQPVETENKPPETKTGKRRKPASLASRFFFFGSAGPDLSFTRQMGETRMLSGAGAGFELNDRLMIRAGFFNARKVYSAEPRDYDPPPAFWNYYPNLQKIDADCRVYEVPLLLSYRLSKNDKRSWIATAGISSYFMKEEKYRYYYKPNPASPITTRDYTIDNQFEHHFSVLTLSGGYKLNLGKKVTVMAEPYLKLPLQGVGFGKVKLNSGGVMFSVGVRPF